MQLRAPVAHRQGKEKNLYLYGHTGNHLKTNGEKWQL